jgi:hypothetical protein
MVSGNLKATCKVCGSIFYPNVDHWIFVDAEMVGTCDDCFGAKDHDIIDEGRVVEDDRGFEQVAVLGRIIFKDREYTEARKAMKLGIFYEKYDKDGKLTEANRMQYYPPIEECMQ